MQFEPLPIEGLLRVTAEPAHDERGWFARLHCEREFATGAVEARMVQTSLSHSAARGSLRGMHLQRAPSREGKLVRCVRGAIFDVVVDLRPGSPSHLQHFALELSAANRLALFIPTGLAHGFQTLEPDSEVLYQMTDFYDPALACGVRWNDPAFGISWPLVPTAVHPRDVSYPDYDDATWATRVAPFAPSAR